jgi:hypothetical protein
MILEKQESHFANGFSASIKYQLLIDDGRTRQFEGIGAAFVGATKYHRSLSKTC